jgi:hypothetical protein
MRRREADVLNAQMALALAKIGGGAGSIVNQNATLDQITAQMTLAVDYEFGSGASGVGVTPIRNSSDLIANFRYYQDAGGLPIPLINSQMERYQPFTASSNFVFGTDHLAITATLDPGGNATVQGGVTPSVGIHLDGTTANLFSNYPTIDPTKISVGQLLAVQFVSGIFYVNSITGTTSFTAITVPHFSGSASNQFNKSIAFLPAYFAPLSAGYNTGDLTLTFCIRAFWRGRWYGNQLRQLFQRNHVLGWTVLRDRCRSHNRYDGPTERKRKLSIWFERIFCAPHPQWSILVHQVLRSWI